MCRFDRRETHSSCYRSSCPYILTGFLKESEGRQRPHEAHEKLLRTSRFLSYTVRIDS